MSIVFIILGVICLFTFIAPLPGIVFNVGSALGIAVGCALILYGIFRKKLPSGVIGMRKSYPRRFISCNLMSSRKLSTSLPT